MATTGNPNSTLVKIWTGATPVALAKLTDASLAVNGATRDITTKDSSGWMEKLPAIKSWSMKGSALVAYDAGATSNTALLLTALTAGTAVTVTFGTGVTGDPKYSGSAYVTSWDSASPGFEANTAVSFNLEGTGALTVGTYP